MGPRSPQPWRVRNRNTVNMVNSGPHEADPSAKGPAAWKKRPKVRPPAEFSGEGETLPEFENCFRRYVKWENLDDEDAIQLIHFCMAGEARNYLDTLEEKDLNDTNSVFKKLKERFCPSSFKLLIHEKLCSEKMKESETINEYISRFTRMAQMLDLSEPQKIAQFTSNLRGPLKEHVIISNPENLNQAFERARLKASAQKHHLDNLEEKMQKLITLQEKIVKDQENKLAIQLTQQIYRTTA